MHFVRARAQEGIAIVDPLAEQLAALGREVTGSASRDLPAFFALPGVFPAALAKEPRFTRALGEAYDAISARGALDAAAAGAASGARTAQA
jgi:fructuronate reductase